MVKQRISLQTTFDDLLDEIVELQTDLDQKDQVIKFMQAEIERLEARCQDLWNNYQEAVHERDNLRTLQANE